MNKILIALSASLFLMFSCKGNKSVGELEDVVSDSDSISDVAVVDTLEQIISETPMPKTADELFDDFFFNYAANRKLQAKRTVFPLPVVTDGKLSHITRDQWKTEHFFMRQGFYTLIFDNHKQMDLVKDTAVSNVTVEKVMFKTGNVKQYVFKRVNGLWLLSEIEVKPMYKNNNASFLKFYQNFARDTAYQMRHLNNPVAFSGPDPDDDFSRMDGVLTIDTWQAFAPELPKDMIYNINYGQTYTGSDYKIFVMRGISNGLEIEMVFKRHHGKWLLMQFTT